jgi:2-polyprenyl-3-methyl-5-hydroxy-6-metoxy-1,4-benzoquinol methylase
MTAPHILKHRDAQIHISRLDPGKWKVSVEALNENLYIHQRTCETAYPVELIQKILDITGPGFLCDEILRDESPSYVQNFLHYDLLAYLDEEQFKNKTLLDFGCGSGASTMILTRMFPDTQIMGVELEESLLGVARARADFYGYNNLELLASPNPNNLPSEAREFDFVVLSGVYEHLLPKERKSLLPRLWEALKPGGILFLNQTPYRGFPIELHTTGGLPLINYLPDAVAHRYAQKFSKRNLKQASWEKMLRMGIRGGSVKEIFRNLKTYSPEPMLLEPSRFGLKDRLDLSRIKYKNTRNPRMGEGFHFAAKTFKLLTGIVLLPHLSLAIKKTQPGEIAVPIRESNFEMCPAR